MLGERRPRVAVIGVLDDKDAAGDAAQRCCRASIDVVFTRSREPARAVAGHADEPGREARPAAPAETVADPRAALERARELAGPGGAVLATGSIYLIADLVREDPARGRRRCKPPP